MSDCILSTYATNNSGYASVWYKAKWMDKSKRIGHHRAVWMEHNGKEIPEGMVVMHSCDTPRCINPEHLSLGTRSDNMRDAVKKGRQVSGAQKLTKEQQRYVLESPITATDLAKELGVSRECISSYRLRMGQKRPKGAAIKPHNRRECNKYA